MVQETKQYAVYVNRAGMGSGYLGLFGIVTWRQDAFKFATMERAADAIRRRGWENDTSVRTGATTAYVVES